MPDIVTLIVIFVLLMYSLRSVTLWTMPFVVHSLDWVLKRANSHGKGVIRSLTRTLMRATWHKPVRELGVTMTLFLWAATLAALATVTALITFSAGCLALAIMLWTTAGVIWWALHWSTQRRYRHRPLPHRRNPWR